MINYKRREEQLGKHYQTNNSASLTHSFPHSLTLAYDLIQYVEVVFLGTTTQRGQLGLCDELEKL